MMVAQDGKFVLPHANGVFFNGMIKTKYMQHAMDHQESQFIVKSSCMFWCLALCHCWTH
jgi:alpha-D-ribose 1-methylphosphonate 5-triphosphate synthase subunit PhnI